MTIPPMKDPLTPSQLNPLRRLKADRQKAANRRHPMNGNDFDTPSQALNYRKLELLEPDWLPSSWPQRLAIGAVWMAHKLLDFFAPDDPITVRQKRDRSGKPMYYVRDRLTGNVQTFDSEAELRIWLEERY